MLLENDTSSKDVTINLQDATSKNNNISLEVNPDSEQSQEITSSQENSQECSQDLTNTEPGSPGSRNRDITSDSEQSVPALSHQYTTNGESSGTSDNTYIPTTNAQDTYEPNRLHSATDITSGEDHMNTPPPTSSQDITPYDSTDIIKPDSVPSGLSSNSHETPFIDLETIKVSSQDVTFPEQTTMSDSRDSTAATSVLSPADNKKDRQSDCVSLETTVGSQDATQTRSESSNEPSINREGSQTATPRVLSPTPGSQETTSSPDVTSSQDAVKTTSAHIISPDSQDVTLSSQDVMLETYNNLGIHDTKYTANSDITPQNVSSSSENFIQPRLTIRTKRVKRKLQSLGLPEDVYSSNSNSYYPVLTPEQNDIEHISFMDILDLDWTIPLPNMSAEDIAEEKAYLRTSSPKPAQNPSSEDSSENIATDSPSDNEK